MIFVAQRACKWCPPKGTVCRMNTLQKIYREMQPNVRALLQVALVVLAVLAVAELLILYGESSTP
jgi:hypothetical protein